MAYAYRAIPAVLAAAGGLAIAFWLGADTAYDVQPRLETASRRPAAKFEVAFPGEFVAGPGVPADLPGYWPRFRGPDFDAVSRDETPLARTWPAGGPKVLWAVPMGTGYAGPAVLNGRVYVLDYDEVRQADTLRCISLDDGREIWRRRYVIPIESDHGVSRTVPAVTDKYVVTFGPKCHVMCVDAATGDFRWGMDLVKQFRTSWPKWYAGQCPLIDGERAILAPAGEEILMVAIDCQSGKVVWKTPNRHGWKMTHSSVMPMEFKGRRMYVYCASGGVTAVAAEDADGVKAGDVLWERDDWQVKFANVPSPVPLGGGHVLLAGGYGSGSMLLRLKEAQGGKFDTEVVWRLTKSRQFGSEQQTPIFYKGHLFAVLPKEAGGLGEQLVCMDLAGNHVWTSGPQYRFGLGPYLIADGLLFAMDDDGLLTMAEATSQAFRPLARAKVLDGHEAWAPMAIAGGRLIVRDLGRMVCLDLRKTQ